MMLRIRRWWRRLQWKRAKERRKQALRGQYRLTLRQLFELAMRAKLK